MKKQTTTNFKIGDFARSIEDSTLIVVVTKNTDREANTFHGTCISGDKRKVGEHERFWLKNNFEKVKVKIEIDG